VCCPRSATGSKSCTPCCRTLSSSLQGTGNPGSRQCAVGQQLFMMMLLLPNSLHGAETSSSWQRIAHHQSACGLLPQRLNKTYGVPCS
jgi:hypothetical protein